MILIGGGLTPAEMQSTYSTAPANWAFSTWRTVTEVIQSAKKPITLIIQCTEGWVYFVMSKLMDDNSLIKVWIFPAAVLLYTHNHDLRTSMNERTHFFIKIYLSHFILERVDVSVVCERWVETGTDSYIDPTSSLNHSTLYYLQEPT